MILVTGATGTFGSHVAKELQKQQKNFKAAGKSGEKAREILGSNVRFVSFDWADPTSFEGLFGGISAIYLVAPPNDASFSTQVIPFLTEAKAAGVQFVVLSSVLGADSDKEGALYQTELAVQQSGIAYSIVRPNFIFQNFINYDLAAVRSGVIYLPSGSGQTSYIDMRDVAAFVVAILNDTTKHAGAIYNLTGAEALDHETVARLFTEVLGVQVSNVNPTEDEYKSALRSYSLPETTVDFMALLYSFIKAGYFSGITNDFESLMKRQPITFRKFVGDHKGIFLNS